MAALGVVLAGGSALLLARLVLYGPWNTARVIAPGDGRPYRVHRAHPDRAAAAATLAELNRRVIVLMRRLRAAYRPATARRLARPPAEPPGETRAAAVARLFRNYSPDHLAENSPRSLFGDTSYTLGDGGTVALCLRGRDGALHDIDLLMFVVVHEVAHLATPYREPPHGELFWRTFAFLLAEGAAAGVLRPVDYGRAPADYCGIPVTYNPFFDRRLRPL